MRNSTPQLIKVKSNSLNLNLNGNFTFRIFPYQKCDFEPEFLPLDKLHPWTKEEINSFIKKNRLVFADYPYKYPALIKRIIEETNNENNINNNENNNDNENSFNWIYQDLNIEPIPNDIFVEIENMYILKRKNQQYMK